MSFSGNFPINFVALQLCNRRSFLAKIDCVFSAERHLHNDYAFPIPIK